MEMNKPREKRPIDILRERRGGVPRELLERTREYNKTDKLVAQILRAGPKTIPEIAAATGLPTPQVTWQVMAMRRYGKLVEDEERDSYFAYALTADQEGQT